ncbi:SET domain-containing protein [Stereum hirsutum FP-91666 SS1]|uniref:SET domain-containing protein n=1 Tax=Stereum hirsutum (strain FP-91666) TaxID=721885 RepID=R7RVV6_STEHR|nr:SET domain-containing protein [Stereum hirsutum FP-91666 SS1]EIM79366.1 SET domain-containing protein [Stereum hirsutum FP-91666 SS1]
MSSLSLASSASITIPTGPVTPPEPPSVEGQRLTASTLKPTFETLGPSSSSTRVSCFWESSVGERLWDRYSNATSWNYTPPTFTHSIAQSQISGGGHGVFATQDIDAGEVVIEERSLLVTFGFTPERRDRELEERILAGMSVEGRKAFLSLGNAFESSEGKVFGRVLTNGIGIGTLEGSKMEGGYVAVAEHIARVNHSCRPATSWRFDSTNFTLQLRALQPITSGSEITTSYIDILLPSSSRQSELRRKYGFTCSCTACTLPPASRELKYSDMSRSLLKTWAKNNGYDVHEKELRAWVSRASSMDGKDREKEDMKMIDRYLNMARTMEREQTWPADVWTRVLQPLVKVYCALGDKENAILWARVAEHLAKVATGHDEGWSKVAENPERSDWWGLVF